MKKQVYNPYLPLYEYVPDAEPYVFEDRVYIYGSHDFADGARYCQGDYVTWSAPVSDLSDWRYEGVIYKRTQDSSNEKGLYELWAPDVVQAADGRYYMYYCLAFVPEIGVAVSDHPAGPFEFYGHVRYADGQTLHEDLPFDPAVFMDDDNRIYLYYGYSPENKPEFPSAEMLMEQDGMTQEEAEMRAGDLAALRFSKGSMVTELEPDMVTVKGKPKMLVPGAGAAKGTGFEGHAFYEASSMRKAGGRYYFIYSSQLSHELCYAVSRYPDHGFSYGGTIISNGDIGYHGNTVPTNMMGNNHGSIIQIDKEWYVFYHRQTHGTESSRQGCAEKISICPDGSISQVEMTSCGLNHGFLEGKGVYPAAIACYLTCEGNHNKIHYGESLKTGFPYIYEEKCGKSEKEHIQYIANISDQTTVGFKYFNMKNTKRIYVVTRGNGKGILKVMLQPDSEPAAEILIHSSDNWTRFSAPVFLENCVTALFFTFAGEGSIDFRDLELGTVPK